MADPVKNIRSLETISTGYTVFEPDQVLTEAQLNNLANYLDDQDRLTRVELLGVGIVGGLRVKQVGSKVKVSKGVGISTDGDLLMLPADATFDRIKGYNEKAPVYSPFYPDDKMIEAFELVREGESDATAEAMSTLPGNLADRVVIMLMESCQKDQDLCSSTDCDNLGKDAINTIRLLLVSRADAGKLLTTLTTDSTAALQLPEVLADRPQIAGAITTTAALATLYRTACNSIHTNLVNNLGLLYAKLPALIGDLFNGDPGTGWITKLTTIKTSFASQNSGIQYYYDFLKDVAETWNALRDIVFEHGSVLCPDVSAFPKHLVLGDLANPVQLRTGLYPSPLIGNAGNVREHARFLVWKLHILINTFALPTDTTITITPSGDESTALEERAIPFYYAYKGELPIHRGWNYRFSMRGAETRNLGYRAAQYGGSAAALNPLNYQIARYDFFRIEGHLGQDVNTVLTKIKTAIAAKNLPITLRAILLHTDTAQIAYKPTMRYSDLHRMHYLLRNEVDSQLDRSSSFSRSLKEEVAGAVSRGEVPDKMDDKSTTKAASDFDTTINSAITQSRKNLTSAGYKQYRADTSWKAQYTMAVDNAGKFKQNFGRMVRTDFSTAFDTFIADNHLQWIDWLDTLIDAKDQQEDNKLLFQNFIKEHPGVEHGAGVTRGGTFVLVYDDSKKVIADFMLPYYAPEVAEEEPAQPALTVASHKPEYVYTGGFKMIEPIDLMFTTQLGNLKATVEADWRKEITTQQDYLKFFTTSVSTISDIVAIKDIKADGGRLTAGITDSQLGYSMQAIDSYATLVDAAREILMQPDLPEDSRKNVTVQLQQAETSLANAINNTAQYIATAKVDISAGSDGSKALSQVTAGMDKVVGKDARSTLRQGMQTAQDKARGDTQKKVIANLMQAKGLTG